MIYESRNRLYVDVNGGYSRCTLHVTENGDYYLKTSSSSQPHLPPGALNLTWNEMIARHWHRAEASTVPEIMVSDTEIMVSDTEIPRSRNKKSV